MIDFTHCKLSELFVHRVGKKTENEPAFISDKPVYLGDPAFAELMSKFLLKPFNEGPWFRFSHPADLQMNEMYRYSGAVLDDPEKLPEQSRHMIEHLYEHSDHPRIPGGEVFFGLFEEILVEDELVNGLVIIKSEVKDRFIKCSEAEQSMQIELMEGIHLRKPDKAVIILNSSPAEGLRMRIHEGPNGETHYWTEEFLAAERIRDEDFHTGEFLDLCREFVEASGPEEGKKDKITFLNKSLDYFNSREEFNEEEFAREVIPEPEKQEKFRSFSRIFSEEKEIEDFGSFTISKEAIKQAKKKFRDKIKLDTGVEIRLPMSNPEAAELYVEKGYDSGRGMNFYKVYFQSEK